MTSVTLQLIVTLADTAAQDVRRFELRRTDGSALPAFTAGAHIRVKTPLGAWRNYSLSNHPQESDRYEIAVKREGRGRGGSLSMVDGVRVGDLLEVHAPENQFALDERATQVLLIAGGIGITPLLSMALYLLSQDKPFKLVYLTREPASTAFADLLATPAFAGKVLIHHDQGQPERALDLWPLLEKPGSVTGRQLYCCGPQGLMDAVRDMTGHWPNAAVRFESFGVDTSTRTDDQPFEVSLRSSGRVYEVPVGRSILEVLRDQGLHIPSSCESGTCGSCKTALLEGQPDHRDLVLMDEEKADHIMVCVSRARGGTLMLDL